MTVIGRRNVSYDREQINLTDADLAGVDLTGANLTNIDFYSANLEGAWIVNANLIGANFVNVDLTDASIHYSKFGNALRGAELTGVDLSEDEPVPEGWRIGSLGLESAR
jgi:uncharacterized protein YjbI with pentapeptide repeats